MSMEVVSYSDPTTSTSTGAEIKVLDTRDFSGVSDPSKYPAVQVWFSDTVSGNLYRAGWADVQGWSYLGDEYQKYTKEGSLYTFTFSVFGSQVGNQYYKAGMYGTSDSDLVGGLSSSVLLNVDSVGNVYKHDIFSSKVFNANTSSTKYGDSYSSSTNFYAEYIASDGDSIIISATEVRYIHSASSTNLLISSHSNPPFDTIVDGNGFSWGGGTQDSNFFFTAFTVSYAP